MKSIKEANATLMSSNSSPSKVWTLNIVDSLVQSLNKICKKNSKTLSSVLQTTSTTKDFKKYKSQNKNALLSIY